MSVGFQASTATVNNAISSIALNMRGLMQQINNLTTFIDGQDDGMAALQAIGFSTASTSGDVYPNPGGASDAAFAMQLIEYMGILSGVYYGTVQQGGTGGTAATMFNFDNAFSFTWGGQ